MPLPYPELSRNARVSSFFVGRTASPILVIDDVLANVDAIADYGRGEARYTQPATYYPGLNAPLPETFTAPLAEALQPFLTGTFGLPASMPCESYFGLVTLSPEDLNLGQSMPHFDVLDDGRLAVLLYLCDEDHGGTAYYRHRSTGLERLNRDNIMTYRSVVAFETEDGLPSGYAVGDHALFACIGQVRARFNRLVVYNGNLLHSGQVDPARLSSDPARGRLTLNLFVEAA